MPDKSDNEPSLDEAWKAINTPTGIDWSGRTRYAAAMVFYQHGEISAEVLEVYRICSRLDNENPLDVLKRWRVGREWLNRYPPDTSGG
ncbi:hypothetical protein MRS76_14405 [Rhizobiaceae bacterium n13]|uniref:Uncharacterized protein n=1 Tax=Ferirhizobium litorale TaxID=2927786 RepID=A0AAE3U4M0_9HYPH|nr:hypothetical protein [Fererhizobium litorale]MDI7863148.1 hypothetical protein [Fererhizobium litorale]MDI7923174.1 hypothetical protein [Fererhizobium litorale]